MTRPILPAPFRLAGGRLWLEDVALEELAAGLAGQPAWLLGHAALVALLARARRAAGGALLLPVGRIGPREVLALGAAAGDWARIESRHEIGLARDAGFAPGRMLVGGPVAEDGLLVDALSAGLALRGPDPANVARIAGALGLPLPAAVEPPPELPAGALARAGGLLAPLLSGPPQLVLDAAWRPAGRARVDVRALAGAGPAQDVTLRGLPAATPVPARLVGQAGRGDWVLVPDARAAEVLLPDPAHPLPAVVMVRGGAWRLLDPRPWPAADNRT